MYCRQLKHRLLTLASLLSARPVMCWQALRAQVRFIWRMEHMPLRGTLWAVFHAKDYLPKPTVVYFLRLRRGTSQHQTRETNAGGGGVRRNTRRVKPTPEEEGYVATQDAWNQRRRRRGTSQHKARETNAGGGGVRRNTRRVKPTPEEEGYVATQDAWNQRRRRRSTSQQKTPEEEEW